MIENLDHDARIVDTGDAPADSWCQMPHPEPGDEPGYVDMIDMIDIEADLRFYLLTPIGLRYVDVCDHAAHLDLFADDLLAYSTAVNPAQAALEAEIDAIEMAAGTSRERLLAIAVD